MWNFEPRTFSQNNVWLMLANAVRQADLDAEK